MGIKFYCPSCDKRLNVKSFLAGKAGFCPHCQAKVQIPAESEPKRPATVEAGASTVLRQTESRLSEPAPAASQPVAASVGHASATGHASGNGHAKGHASVAPSGPAPTQHGPAQQGPAQHAPPGVAAPVVPRQPAAIPQGVAYPAQGVAPVRPAMPAAAPVTPVQPVAPVGPTAPPPALADPIAEAPHAVWYVRPPAGGQYGPAVGEVMRKWLAEGRVGGDSLVWREGWPDWRKADKTFPSLGGGPAVAPAAAASPLLGAPAPASSTTRRVVRSPRRDNTALAITAIVVLVLASIGLLVGLFWVLGVIG